MRATEIIGSVANVVLALCAVTVTGLVVHERVNRERAEGPHPRKLVHWTTLGDRGHRIGSRDAAVTIVEFADFQCPYCALAESTLRSIRAKYPNDVAVVYRHYPLKSIHPYAVTAAMASECAAGQGRFEQFHDLLFEERDSVGTKAWTSFAHAAGVTDLHEFTKCLGRRDVAARIEEDVKAAQELNITVTPTLIVRDSLFPGAPVEAELDRTIAALLRSRSRRQPAAF